MLARYTLWPCVCPSVRLSVRLSDTSRSSCKTAKFSYAKDLDKIPAEYVWVEKIATFDKFKFKIQIQIFIRHK